MTTTSEVGSVAVPGATSPTRSSAAPPSRFSRSTGSAATAGSGRGCTSRHLTSPWSRPTCAVAPTASTSRVPPASPATPTSMALDALASAWTGRRRHVDGRLRRPGAAPPSPGTGRQPDARRRWVSLSPPPGLTPDNVEAAFADRTGCWAVAGTASTPTSSTSARAPASCSTAATAAAALRGARPARRPRSAVRRRPRQRRTRHVLRRCAVAGRRRPRPLDSREWSIGRDSTPMRSRRRRRPVCGAMRLGRRPRRPRPRRRDHDRARGAKTTAGLLYEALA